MVTYLERYVERYSDFKIIMLNVSQIDDEKVSDQLQAAIGRHMLNIAMATTCQIRIINKWTRACWECTADPPV